MKIYFIKNEYKNETNNKSVSKNSSDSSHSYETSNKILCLKIALTHHTLVNIKKQAITRCV